MDKEKIALDLAELGDTAEEVASTLLKLGCKGTRCANSCPIAVYLKGKGYENPRALRHQIEARSLGGNEIAKLDTPPPISRFISAFDDGSFAQLRLEGW